MMETAVAQSTGTVDEPPDAIAAVTKGSTTEGKKPFAKIIQDSPPAEIVPANSGLDRFASGKAIDFQIRVKVVQGRQLLGGNVDPVARVKVGSHLRQTRIKKSTPNPWWNETFFLNFNLTPSELQDELLVLSVYNARTMRSDAFLGSFKCDVGMIYSEADHALINKWVLLSDPDDATLTPKGYLKICACVLGPGDVAPNMDTGQNEDDEDIERNLLTPVGVTLRPATFSLYVYQAEDIPIMDSDAMRRMKVFQSDEKPKELVDPYFVFNFAGKEVHSKIIQGTYNPKWQQVLQLGLQFPSLCERIKLQFWDWDRVGSNECICTKHLCVSLLSSLESNGFLPTFGPCYINMYGATRELSDLPKDYKDLNSGKVPGIAYRGRALVQLKTILDNVPEVAAQDLSDDDRVFVEKFTRKRKYRLFAAFYNASLISSSLVDAPIQFEISMGNYGNSLDKKASPCPSTTPPTFAAFDGCYYYFLPWNETKPCVVVDCQWEDVSFRLESLNMLLNIQDRLKTGIEKLRIGLQSKKPIPDLAKIFVSMLDVFIIDCDTPLSHPKVWHATNELDMQKEKLRRDTLRTLKAAAIVLRDTATSVNDAIVKTEEFLESIKHLTAEPQNSMPDIMLWMISDQKRIAYFQIPAHELLYSDNDDMKGRNCGKIISVALEYPGAKQKNKMESLPAVVTLKLWLGLQTESTAWTLIQDGEMSVCAETYENEVFILGSWSSKKPALSRPKWSDVAGKIKLKKDEFITTQDWQWDGDWYINPEVGVFHSPDDGCTTFTAEIYECSSRVEPGGSWDAASPPWTDMKGDSTTERTKTVLPDGWHWDDEWRIDVNRAVNEEGWEYCVDPSVGGYQSFEEPYHLYRRRRWVRSRTHILEVSLMKQRRDKLLEMEMEGWEYAPLFSMKFSVECKTMDLVRRRRWHRKMISFGNPETFCLAVVHKNKAERCNDDTEGVETETTFTTVGDVANTSTIMTKTTVVAEDDAVCVPDAITSTTEAHIIVPRVFLTFKVSHYYQLRAYIYSARDLIAADDVGLSDPFARVSFLNQSLVTEKQKLTLSPTWNQTLIFEKVQLHIDPEVVEDSPPDIYIELFDYDTYGKPDFLGRTKVQPMVKLDPCDPRTPRLQWYSITRNQQDGGELLAAFELIMITKHPLPFFPPKIGDIFCVPSGIRPALQRTGIEVLCWGVRNMKNYQMLAVTSPSVRFEIGGHVQHSVVIKDTRRSPNFSEQRLFFDVMLPKDELYMPPMNITVKDHRQFGRTPTIGVHTMRSLEEYSTEDIESGEAPCPIYGQSWEIPLSGSNSDTIISITADIEICEKESASTLLELDWWSKFYASRKEFDKCKKYCLLQYDTLEVVMGELEKVPHYKGFNDFCQTLPLFRGKQDMDAEDDDDSNIVGEFKGSFCRYPLPADPAEPLPGRVFENVPSSDLEECLVRVYVIRATDLQPCDVNGLADPYIEIEIGKQKINNREEYIPNTLNPEFGRMFELKAIIPIYKDLIIRVKDFDFLTSDDIVGETIIDLEKRYLTKYRATCGLPKTFCISGINMWRDCQTPVDILLQYCQGNQLDLPVYLDKSTVNIGNKQYRLSDFEANKSVSKHWGPENQRLALHILNMTPLVKEHVENRALFSELQPSIEQGRLHLWVDIFPKSLGPPALPFDITPRKPLKYVLSIIIWNTKDVILDDISFTGQKMSDIYVQGWMDGIDKKLKTDVHYRSLNGEGNFNWRFVFPFEYLLSEQIMVIKKKEHLWSMNETEFRKPAKLNIQIWDNDKFFSDDFLGLLELNLNAMPLPVKNSRSCKLDMLPEVGRSVKLASIFEVKHVRGFWPCFNDSTGVRQLTGKVEMEIQLLTGEEFEKSPSGVGREDPNANPKLDPPNRPETSFFWFTSPWKMVKFVIWYNYRWRIIKALILLPLMVLFIMFVYSLPGQLGFWVING